MRALNRVFKGRARGDQPTLPAKVKRILLKYNATMLLPGVSGVLRFGYQPGNYRESTGQTLAAADQQVGLVVDAARVPGVELVTNGDFSNGTSGWTLGTGWSISGGTATHSSAAGAGILSISSVLAISKWYVVEFDRLDAGASAINVMLGNTYLSVFPGVGRKRVIGQATANTVFGCQGGGDYVIDNISVRELPGSHASQSTSGFQPVLRRGLVNLFYPSEAYTGWTALDGASIGGSTATLSANWSSRVEKANSAIGANATGTAAVNIEGSGYVAVSVRENGGSYGVLATTEVELSNEQQLVVLHFNTSSISNVLVQIIARNVVCALGSARVGMFKGTVTAEEIIAAGGIPVTTSAPASSANGIQSWQFDGTDDRLSLSAVPFQISDDPFCIVAFECGALGANRSVIDLATSASSARFANLRINAIGQPQSVVVNDAVSATLITANEVSAGTKLVLAATTVEGVQKLYVEGAYVAEAVLSGTFTPTESYIGSKKGTSENFNGPIHCVIFGKGAISGAELLTLEKFAASLQGRSL